MEREPGGYVAAGRILGTESGMWMELPLGYASALLVLGCRVRLGAKREVEAGTGW